MVLAQTDAVFQEIKTLVDRRQRVMGRRWRPESVEMRRCSLLSLPTPLFWTSGSYIQFAVQLVGRSDEGTLRRLYLFEAPDLFTLRRDRLEAERSVEIPAGVWVSVHPLVMQVAIGAPDEHAVAMIGHVASPSTIAKAIGL